MGTEDTGTGPASTAGRAAVTVCAHSPPPPPPPSLRPARAQAGNALPVSQPGGKRGGGGGAARSCPSPAHGGLVQAPLSGASSPSANKGRGRAEVRGVGGVSLLPRCAQAANKYLLKNRSEQKKNSPENRRYLCGESLREREQGPEEEQIPLEHWASHKPGRTDVTKMESFHTSTHILKHHYLIMQSLSVLCHLFKSMEFG
ncbi:uncharacterized protein LOC128143701 [Harpia harpyja]|uniref:uncharacterized protein LOC128143701 n=1 Tax=Harpia harpyja TaxID=202280 RepID=UPI0022B0839B|nr:uncharacterized protein LOC128143701 [Harpia harpyja]